MLGKASSIIEFIKVGEESAEVEVELFHPDKEKICRKCDQSG